MLFEAKDVMGNDVHLRLDAVNAVFKSRRDTATVMFSGGQVTITNTEADLLVKEINDKMQRDSTMGK